MWTGQLTETTLQRVQCGLRPMSRSRCVESRSMQRRKSCVNRIGVVEGSAVQAGSRSRIFAIVSETVSPRNAASPVNAS